MFPVAARLALARFTLCPSWTALIIFVVALWPRLYTLGGFLTIDEVKWAEGAAQFWLALHSGNLAQTYWHFFPGITITWGSALILGGLCLPWPDLTQCAHHQVADLTHSIGWLRLSTVFLTSAGIVGVYLLGRRLVGDTAALLAALLLAVDPFFLAHSRILNGDAVTAILMFLSLLAFLDDERLAGSRQPPRLFIVSLMLLILSAVLAGLALLTKLPAPLLVGYVGVLSLVAMLRAGRRQGWAAVWFWFISLIIWAGVVLFTFIAVWPVMWVAPVETLRQLYLDSFEVGQVGAGHDAFFLSQTLDDPGPWFYPYAIAFRLTPVVMLGLLFTLIWLGSLLTRRLARGSLTNLQSPISNLLLKTAWILLGYILFIILLANVSPKKLDRYVMGVIPPLVFLAALGLSRGMSAFVGLIFPGLRHLQTVALTGLIIAGLVVYQASFAFFAAPYYLTYYNPLLGGTWQAAARVPVGWGEGLEQAAYFLNQQPHAASLRVSSWYGDIFQPYFVGQKASFADDGRAQLAADYVVFYINQIQRQKPYPGLINYFRAQKPVFTVKIGPTGNLSADGPNWVEVYQAPAAQSAGGAPKIEGVAQLLAYKVTNRQAAAHISELAAGTELTATLFLRVLGPLPERAVFQVGLQNSDNPERVLGVWQPGQMKGIWQTGAVIEWPGILALPPEMPPGDYRLWIALQDEQGGIIAPLVISTKDPIIKVSAAQ